MVTMEKHILKYFLIFNLYCLFTFNVYSQEADSLNEESSRSIVIKDNLETIYPGKPLLMSLVLPGAGQYYNKAPKWKTALFFGAELASILAWNNFKNRAESIREDYQNFARLSEGTNFKSCVPVKLLKASIFAHSALSGLNRL